MDARPALTEQELATLHRRAIGCMQPWRDDIYSLVAEVKRLQALADEGQGYRERWDILAAAVNSITTRNTSD